MLKKSRSPSLEMISPDRARPVKRQKSLDLDILVHKFDSPFSVADSGSDGDDKVVFVSSGSGKINEQLEVHTFLILF